MPELPEVETSRRGISPHIEGHTISSFEIRNTKLRWPVPVKQLKNLIGEQLLSVERRGKYIKLVCPSGYMLIHLGMSGSLRIITKQQSQQQKPQKHDHIDLLMSNGVILRYNDPRRFGCWLFQKDTSTEHKLLATLGPEPLDDAFNGEYLYQLSRNKTKNIKTFIMDSHIVVGVGNIYAAEALFKAGIHPKKAAGKVSKSRMEQLVAAIKTILSMAIEQGGTTLRDFTNSDGKPGYFKQELMVYGREEEPCFICQKPIKNIKLGQRSTFFCVKCQK